MRLAMRLPEKKPGDSGVANDIDPREGSDAEVIDLAQRNAFPVVARPAGKSDALGLVAGIAILFVCLELLSDLLRDANAIGPASFFSQLSVKICPTGLQAAALCCAGAAGRGLE